MSDSAVGRYWCYECHRVVTGVEESEPKCPNCDSGFVEEIWSRGASSSGSDSPLAPSDGSRTSRPFWDPVLFGMLADSSRRAWEQREDEDDEEEDSDLDREFEELLSRRRRSSAVIRVLHSLYFVDGVEFDEFDVQTEGEGERDNDDGASLVLINSSNQAFFIQGSLNSDRNQGGDDSNGGGDLGISFGDYFLGPGLDLLMQHFAENDPNMYGTPPAKQEAVDALPTVIVSETLSCSVCLEDFEIGTDAKEMPCKHKFHTQCLFPWLELHCSCPLCRFQLPSDESKISNRSSNHNRAEDADRLNARNRTGNGANSGDEDESWITWVDDDESWVPVTSPSDLVPPSEDENRGSSSSNQNSSASSSRDI